MEKNRLEAFSDGVIAVIITIMVLELKVPSGTGWIDLAPLLPILLTYGLSFLYVGIYWNNHHHMLNITKRVNGAVLWANLHLLFWLSLVPWLTGWMGQHADQPQPTALYGFVLLMAALAYSVLQRTIIHAHASNASLQRAVGHDLKGLGSLAAYAVAVACAFWHPWIAQGLYVGVALMWLIPDRRIERNLVED